MQQYIKHYIKLYSFQVKTFLDLQQKAAEIMAAVAIWELELNDVELELKKVNKHGKLFTKDKISPSYK